jgi:lycopene cyclase domain-containing protein
MTYWSYHLIFTLPLIAVLTVYLWPHLRPGHWMAWGVTCLIVVLFTIPWDNYAAFLGIWGFGEGVSLGYPFRSWAETSVWLGHIPFEEYAYFVIEATLACQLTLFLMTRGQRRVVAE